MMAMGLSRRLALAVALVLAPLALATPARASVTIGQVADPAATASCIDGNDWLQPTVKSGNSFLVPGAGTITSWTTSLAPGPGTQMTMKIFRAVSGPANTYRVVGHAGPQTIPSMGTVGNFPANIPVQPGDVLGLNTPTSDYCMIPITGENYLAAPFDLADGAQQTFTALQDDRLSIAAIFAPTNTFALTGTQRNKKRGTATLTLNLPNPGELIGAGQGAQVASAGAHASKPLPAGPATLLVKPAGKKKRKLNATGGVKVTVFITYTPSGGDPGTESLKVKLKKKT
jgi:hypothetical protein